MDPEQIRAAAVKRSEGVRARADRPSKRSSRGDGEMDPRVHARIMEPKFEKRTLDEVEDVLLFTGYASITDTPYEMYDWYGPYTEIVEAGAFAKTLTQVALDVPLVIQHEAIRRIALTLNSTLRLSEDVRGLRVEADLDPRDSDVAYILPKMQPRIGSGPLIDEMSFKFRIVEGWWNEDFTEFRIKEVDLHRGDVAIVAYGANPYTKGLDLSAARNEIVLPTPIRGADLISLEDTALRVM